ncbi:MAG: alpha/beta fold hydrolase [Planctomycetaceae bacterium]
MSRVFRLKRLLNAVVAALIAVVMGGCTTTQFVELREKPRNPLAERLNLTALGGPAPSERTQRFLAMTHYRGGRDNVLLLQHAKNQLAGNEPHEALHVAAEVSYLSGQAAALTDPALAMELYLDSAYYGWQYLDLPTEDGGLVDPNAMPHRETVEVYNTSVEEFLRLARRSGDYSLLRSMQLPVSGRRISFELPFPSAWLNADQLDGFEFASDYELKNLRNRHVSPGIGVPIIVTRRRHNATDGLERYYSDGMRFPATVVLTFAEPGSRSRDQKDVRLQLYDPRDTDGIVMRDTLIPIETDLSTPLARMLTNPKLRLLDTFALLRPDRAKHLQGLYMVQPYDPDRIPVLMVHGVWSSPMTWMEMFNDLQSDPRLREKYQFWFYMYPTGEPMTFAAADLRDELRELRQRCDPFQSNDRLDEMVLVGHSMGGIMSYLMTVDSEDKLWNATSRLSVDEIQTDAETRSEIRRVFFFQSNRSIGRIVTIASPFAGSGYANSFTRWLSGSVISLPNRTSRLSELIFRQNHSGFWDRMFAPKTSVDSLAKDSAVLRLVGNTTVSPEVRHHNIVGIEKGTSAADWTDGVVKYTSAHRDDADSEIQVRAAHSAVHRHPEAISEVRRVLLEHLTDAALRRYPVVPVGASTRASMPAFPPVVVP